MSVPSTSLTRQDLVRALKSLRSLYTTESDALNTQLDQNHHAFKMKEYGENKQLHECLAELKKLIVKYDESTVTITFNENGCTGTVPTLDPQVPESSVNLPTKGSLVPPDGKKLYGWNTKADGSGVSYKFSASFAVPTKNITLYALLGPDPTYVAPTP